MDDSYNMVMGLSDDLFDIPADTAEPSTENPNIYQEAISASQAATLIGRNNILPNSKYYLITTEREVVVTRIEADGSMREFTLEEEKGPRRDTIQEFTVRSSVLPQDAGRTHATALNVMLVCIGLLFLFGISIAFWLFTI